METIANILVGALITWFLARYYFKKAGNELKEEADKLRKLNILMLRALEEAGLAKFNRNENNEIIGLVINLSAVGTMGDITGNLTAKKIEKDSNE